MQWKKESELHWKKLGIVDAKQISRLYGDPLPPDVEAIEVQSRRHSLKCSGPFPVVRKAVSNNPFSN